MTHDAITALFREIGIAETVRFLHLHAIGTLLPHLELLALPPGVHWKE